MPSDARQQTDSVGPTLREIECLGTYRRWSIRLLRDSANSKSEIIWNDLQTGEPHFNLSTRSENEANFWSSDSQANQLTISDKSEGKPS